MSYPSPKSPISSVSPRSSNGPRCLACGGSCKKRSANRKNGAASAAPFFLFRAFLLRDRNRRLRSAVSALGVNRDLGSGVDRSELDVKGSVLLTGGDRYRAVDGGVGVVAPELDGLAVAQGRQFQLEGAGERGVCLRRVGGESEVLEGQRSDRTGGAGRFAVGDGGDAEGAVRFDRVAGDVEGNRRLSGRNRDRAGEGDASPRVIVAVTVALSGK